MVRWDFCMKEDHVAVSEEEYDMPLIRDDISEIEIYLDGERMDGEVLFMTYNVSEFVYVTLGTDNEMHYYIECDNLLYELFGTTMRKSLDALTLTTKTCDFDALKVGDNLVYSWGREWYLIAPLEWKNGRE